MSDPAHALSLASQRWSRGQRLWAMLGLIALDLLLSLYCIQDIPLIDPDEPRYAAAGRTMSEGGSWLIPSFNGESRLNKPPLFYWLVAVSDLAFGEASELSARFPSILMGLVMLGLTVWLGVRLFDDKTGFWAGLMLCTTPLYLAISRSCITDQTFSTLLACSLGCFLLGLCGRWPFRSVSSVFMAGLFAGLALMAKGTASLIVPLTPLLFVLLSYRRELRSGPGWSWICLWAVMAVAGLAWGGLRGPGEGIEAGTPFLLRMPVWGLAACVMTVLCLVYYGLRNYWRGRSWGAAVLLALVLGSWWYLLHIGTGVIDIRRMYEEEILGRLSGKMHRESISYYFYVFPALILPWSVGLFGALGVAWGRVDAALPLPDASPRAAGVAGDLVTQIADRFLCIWVIAVIFFFSIPGAKLGTYVLPAVPAATLLISRYVMRISRTEPSFARGWKIVTMTIAFFLIEALTVGAFEPHEQEPGLKGEIPPYGVWSGVFIGCVMYWMFVTAFVAARASMLLTDPESPPRRRRWYGLGMALLPFAGGGLAALAVIPTRLIEFPNRWQSVIDRSPIPLWLLMILATVFICLPWIAICATRYARLVLPVPAFLNVTLVLIVLPLVLPVVNRRSNKDLCAKIGPLIREASHLYSVGCEEESICYYLHRTIKEVRRPEKNKGESHREVVRETLLVAPPGQVVLFVHHRYFNTWLKRTAPVGSRKIYEDGHIVVLMSEPAETGGVGDERPQGTCRAPDREGGH